MKTIELDRKIAQLHEWLDRAEQRARTLSLPGEPVGKELIEELRNALEELHVAQEELHTQNEEISASRSMLDQERIRYMELFENAPDGMLITDLAGKIKETNTAALQLMGTSAPLQTGKPLAVFVKQSDRRTFRSRLNDLQKSSQKATLEWEMDLQRRDGTVRNVLAKVRVLHDEIDRPSGLHWLLRNITLQRQSELQIRFQASLLDAVDQGVIVVDPGGKVLYSNRAIEEIYGWSREEVLGHDIAEIGFPPALRSQVHLVLSRIAQGEHWQEEFDAVRRDGSTFPVLATAIPLPKVGDSAAAIIGISTDVSVLKRTELELQKANRIKENLLDELRHRVRNNLQTIYALLALQSSAVESLEMAVLLKESQKRVRTIAQIQDQIFQSQDPSLINLGEFLHRLAARLFKTYHADPQKIALTVDSPEIVLPLNTALPCILVMGELVSNAVRHAFPGERRGKIRIGAQAMASGEVRIWVVDDGVGLPPDLKPHLSAALGLRLVSSLAKQLGAGLEFAGPPGTAVTLVIPPDRGKGDLKP